MHSSIYTISKDGVVLTFQSEMDACDFIGVVRCSVASCFRRGAKCKGFRVERVGLSTHGETKTRLHKIWSSMHERCEYRKHQYYRNYGGRGIYVTPTWSDYTVFRDWALENGYNDFLTIDRIDPDKGYEPENCRWVSNKQQQNNKRNNRRITHNGETHTISEWSEITGIGKTTIKERLNSGWPADVALTKPVRIKRQSKMDEAAPDGN